MNDTSIFKVQGKPLNSIDLKNKIISWERYPRDPYSEYQTVNYGVNRNKMKDMVEELIQLNNSRNSVYGTRVRRTKLWNIKDIGDIDTSLENTTYIHPLPDYEREGSRLSEFYRSIERDIFLSYRYSIRSYIIDNDTTIHVSCKDNSPYYTLNVYDDSMYKKIECVDKSELLFDIKHNQYIKYRYINEYLHVYDYALLSSYNLKYREWIGLNISIDYFYDEYMKYDEYKTISFKDIK